MIFDVEMKAGLVFGIDTGSIILMNEDEELTEDKEESTIISIYLGFLAFHVMF